MDATIIAVPADSKFEAQLMKISIERTAVPPNTQLSLGR